MKSKSETLKNNSRSNKTNDENLQEAELLKQHESQSPSCSRCTVSSGLKPVYIHKINQRLTTRNQQLMAQIQQLEEQAQKHQVESFGRENVLREQKLKIQTLEEQLQKKQDELTKAGRSRSF